MLEKLSGNLLIVLLNFNKLVINIIDKRNKRTTVN